MFLLLAISYLALRPNPGATMSSGVDKLDHLTAFASLTLAALGGFGPVRRGRITFALMGYGVLIELVQTQVPGRSAEALDVLADSIGIAAGLLIAGLASGRLAAKS